MIPKTKIYFPPKIYSTKTHNDRVPHKKSNFSRVGSLLKMLRTQKYKFVANSSSNNKSICLFISIILSTNILHTLNVSMYVKHVK